MHSLQSTIRPFHQEMDQVNHGTCFSCGDRFSHKFLRYLPSSNQPSVPTDKAATREDPDRPYIVEWRQKRLGSGSPWCCVFCFKDLHSQWLRFEANGTPFEDRNYRSKRDIQVRLGDGVCFLCGGVFTLSTMFRLSQSYYPFLARYPVPQGSAPIDAKGHVVTCEPCRSTVYVQWKQFEDNGVKEPNRVFVLRIGDVDVRVSLASLLLPRRGMDFTGQLESVRSQTVHHHPANSHRSSPAVATPVHRSKQHPSQLLPTPSTTPAPLPKAKPTPPQTDMADVWDDFGKTILNAVMTNCYLCGKSVPFSALKQVRYTAPLPSDAPPALHFPFLNRIPPAKGSQSAKNGSVLLCPDCNETLLQLHHIQQISSSKPIAPDTVCYICGNLPYDGKFNYLSGLSFSGTPKVPHFPTLVTGPRAKGSRPPDERSRLLACSSCRISCYAVFFNYERHSMPVDTREYIQHFACYVCGSGGTPAKAMHWIPSLPIDSQPDCYPFLIGFKPVRGAAELNALGCALVCASCQNVLFSQFLNMERAHVPPQYRTYTVNGRAFDPPKLLTHTQSPSGDDMASSREAKTSGQLVSSSLSSSLIQQILNSKPQIAPKPPLLSQQPAGVRMAGEVESGSPVGSVNGGVAAAAVASSNGPVFASPQQVMLDQRKKFHIQVGRLQSALERTDNVTLPQPAKIVTEGTLKMINGRRYFHPISVGTTCENVRQTQKHAKALAKHGQDKMKFLRTLGLVSVEECEEKKEEKPIIYNYPFVEEEIYVTDGEDDEEGKKEGGGENQCSLNFCPTSQPFVPEGSSNLCLMKVNTQEPSSDEDETIAAPMKRPYPRIELKRKLQRPWGDSDDDDEELQPPKKLSQPLEIQHERRKESLLAALAGQCIDETRKAAGEGSNATTKDSSCCSKCSKEGGFVVGCSVCHNGFHFDCENPMLETPPSPGNCRLCPSCLEDVFQGPGVNVQSWPGVIHALQSLFTATAEWRHEILWRRKEIVRLERQWSTASAEAEALTEQVLALVDKKKQLADIASEIKETVDKLSDLLDDVRKACS
eukprot:m.89548 g.89548  ORF g.89548 m.89548 type:complete len:1046 (+) comp36609_c0_seq3:215-3352(+)